MDSTNPNYWLIPLSELILGLDYPEHFHEWGYLTEKEKRLLVLASRDHGKTTFFDIILPTDRILRNTGYKILIVSYSDTQVLKIGSAIKGTFDNKPMLKSFSPRSDEDWSKSRMLFKDGSLIETLAFGSTGRGGHYDLVLIDDPVKDFGGMNPDEQSQYLIRTIMPMVKPDGQLIVTGNYIYENDLIDRVEKNKAFTTVKYPAISNGKPLWPEYWPLDKLAERRRELESSDDPFSFQKEYLLEKVDSKSQFFKRGMFKFYDPNSIPELLSTVGSWDPAISLNGDFNAMMVTGTAEDKKTYLMPEYAEFRSDDVKALIDEVFRLTELYDIPYWLLETIGFQKLLKEHLYEAMREKSRHFGINEVKTHIKSKQARIMALQPRIASGSLLFHPTAHKDIIDQFCAFPRGQHDDMVDALSFQIAAWDKPVPPKPIAPYGSVEWWKGQVDEPADSWYTTLSK